ncbi:unnamed protein product [Boreogadus saida]
MPCPTRLSSFRDIRPRDLLHRKTSVQLVYALNQPLRSLPFLLPLDPENSTVAPVPPAYSPAHPLNGVSQPADMASVSAQAQATSPAQSAPLQRGIVKMVLSGCAIIVRGQPRGGPPPERQINLSNIRAGAMARRAALSQPDSKDTPDGGGPPPPPAPAAARGRCPACCPVGAH